jgi:hypothetical protein
MALKLERPANELADRPIILGYENPARGTPPYPAADGGPAGLSSTPSLAGLRRIE